MQWCALLHQGIDQETRRTPLPPILEEKEKQ